MKYAPQLITPPASEPLSSAEAQVHLRTEDFDDTYVASLISAARKLAEDQFELAFVTQTWLQVCDDWWATAVEIPRPPIQDVDKVEYLDAAVAWQELDPLQYRFDKYTRLLQWVDGADIPELASNLLGRVRITWTSGWQNNVPESAKHALLMLIGHFYENREALTEGSITDEIELAFSHLMYSNTEDYL